MDSNTIKRFLVGTIVSIGIVASAQNTNPTYIKNGQLQGNLNAGGYSITNSSNVVVYSSNFTVSPSNIWSANASQINSAIGGGTATNASVVNGMPGIVTITNTDGVVTVTTTTNNRYITLSSGPNNLTNGQPNANIGSNYFGVAITNNNGGFYGNAGGLTNIPGSAIVSAISATNLPSAAVTNSNVGNVVLGSNLTVGSTLTVTNITSSNQSVKFGDGSNYFGINETSNTIGMFATGNSGSLFEFDTNGDAILSTYGTMYDNSTFVHYQYAPRTATTNVGWWTSVGFFGSTGSTLTYPEIVDFGPGVYPTNIPAGFSWDFTHGFYNDEAVFTGNSNLYNVRIGARGDIFFNCLWYNFTNVSGTPFYTAHMGDRYILANPTNVSCLITLPALGSFGQVIVTNPANETSWTAGNGKVVTNGPPASEPANATLDYTVVNMGSNLTGTVKVVLADHSPFLNAGGTNILVPNQTACRFTTDGTNVLAQFIPMTQNAILGNINVTSVTNTSGNIYLPLQSTIYGGGNVGNPFTILQSWNGNSIAVGVNSLFASNATVTPNNVPAFVTSLGYYAGYSQNSNALDNVAVGSFALQDDVIGSYNTAIGAAALQLNTSGTNNIGIGNNAGANYTTSESQNILIGSPGVIHDFGIIRIGTAGQQSSTYLTGTIYGTTYEFQGSNQTGAVWLGTNHGPSLFDYLGNFQILADTSGFEFKDVNNSYDYGLWLSSWPNFVLSRSSPPPYNNGRGLPVTSCEIPFVGGDASGMRSLPAQNQEIRNLMPLPQIVLWGYGTATTNNFESYHTNWLYACSTNGIVAGLSNFCTPRNLRSPLIDEIDSCWTAPHLTNGVLWFNTNWPDGIAGVAGYAHSNYAGIELAAYVFPGSFQQSGEQDVTYNTGQLNTNVGNNVYPAIQMDTVTNNITNFYAWGVDKLRLQNCTSDTAYKNQVANLFDFAVLNPNFFPWNTQESVAPSMNKTNLRPIAIGMIVDFPTAHSVNGLNQWSMNQGAPNFTNFPAYVNGSGQTNHALENLFLLQWYYTNEANLILPGAQPDFWDDVIAAQDLPTYLGSCAILGATISLSPQTNTPYFTNYYLGLNAYQNYITNTSFLTVLLDPLHQPPTKVYDSGLGQFAFTKVLSNGNYGVFLGNMASTNWIPTISWATLGLPTNQAYIVTSMVGTNYGQQIGSLTDTVSNYSGNLYLFSSVPFYGNQYTWFTANHYRYHTNGTYTNSGSVTVTGTAGQTWSNTMQLYTNAWTGTNYVGTFTVSWNLEVSTTPANTAWATHLQQGYSYVGTSSTPVGGGQQGAASIFNNASYIAVNGIRPNNYFTLWLSNSYSGVQTNYFDFEMDVWKTGTNVVLGIP